MSFLKSNAPVLIVCLISLVIGWLMVVVFGYTSNQKAIHVAKEHLKAHLLALRLFQDQIPVVIRSYGRIFLATGRYLQLAFKPLLFVILPLTFMVVQLDRYLGLTPMEAGQPFLVKARVSNPEVSNEASLQLPSGLTTTAPAVHVPADNEVAWRVVAEKDGDYDVNVQASDQTVAKRVVVASGLARLSPIRLRGQFWERIFVSGEPALPQNSLIQAIEVQYPARSIAFAGVEWNWIWLFLVLSMIAGFLFKSILGIEI
jgi:hypothetical protein